MPAPPGLPAAVMWDMDGTLVDTEPYWIEAEYALVAEFGGTWSDDLAHQLVGNALLTSAQFIIDNTPVTLAPEAIVHRLMSSVIDQVGRRVPWRPGAQDLLVDLRRYAVPCALVSMSWSPLTSAVTAHLPEDAFAAVISGDHVINGKPHPEPYLAAATALGVEPQHCVAIEDSATGATSAIAAGYPTLVVPHTVPVPPLTGARHLPTLVGLDTLGLSDLMSGAGLSGT
jgi:beta-phosphoglucomutase-like phosphatase (HAD superfamily)